ncbi:MFS transporter [Pusillimonas sp. CC-YST705]|uniref:MFS transporter n=1 Tax=Mesopusillimonas faecipullorum TaxID=2755040 RepID=A0ABS8CD62_9BURK|nr:MFS transporter [Mesopusillimonas faecipullorum]MCB5363982.1 MFS transporter [Mesopusillimonas faecipullorum]
MNAHTPASPPQNRNLNLLVAAQALGAATPPIIISLGGLVGQMLSSNPSLATLPVSLYQLGLALSTIPTAFAAKRWGRRNTYLMGGLVGALSALLAAWAIFENSFVYFCLGVTLAGFYAACVQSYRFAAADTATPEHRARAISLIMVGGLIAAVLGPQVVIWTREALPATPFAGSFISMAVLAFLALPLIAKLRIPRAAAAAHTHTSGRPLLQIARTPRFPVAVLAGVVSFGLMSFIMTAAPMAMVGCGYSVGTAALGIQWHVLAMFGPSFFTGKLIERFGNNALTAFGLILIAASGMLALGGLALTHFWGSLILLGVGWNFSFIGATSMVTDCYQPSERAKVQAVNDFLVFGTVAAASFFSGHLLNTAGWEAINMYMMPIVAVVLMAQLWLARTERRQATS